MKLYITESNMRKYILSEDKRGEDAKKRCLQVIRNHFDNADWLDTTFNHTDNPEGLSFINYMYKQFMSEFYHDPNYRSRPVMRLAPLFCKLAFESNFQNYNPDTQKLNRLASILRFIYIMDEQGKKASSKIDIVNTTFDELNNQFGTIIDDLNRQENERIQNTQYERNLDYEVIGPVDYETANSYGNQSCSTSKLCYTQTENTWNNYTQNGCNNVYIILKNGWENIPEKHDDESNSAYDTYGLSMIFVFVDGAGNLAYCNTRWNHNANYESGFSCDHAMSKEWISRLIGVNFDEVFKPNNKWRELLTQIEERLKNGEDSKNIFDYVAVNSDNELTPVKIEGQGFNFINKQGELVWKENKWFDSIGFFHEGITSVSIKGRGNNFITEQGELLWKGEEWFDTVYDFANGFAWVYKKGRGVNFINKQGELVWNKDKWFYDSWNCNNGIKKVYLEGKGYNFINPHCGLVWKEEEWFNEAYLFDVDGFAIVKMVGRGWNYINPQGELLWKGEEWFDNIDDYFTNGFASVKIDGKYNFINKQGELVWKGKEWFDKVDKFYDGFTIVDYKGERYYLGTKGELYDKNGNRVTIGLQESKRRLIRLTESDIHQLVIKTLKEYLLK